MREQSDNTGCGFVILCALLTVAVVVIGHEMGKLRDRIVSLEQRVQQLEAKSP